MFTDETTSTIFVILVLLAFIAIAQFIRGRKINLLLISFTADKMEEIMKPRDKIYQWIGLYVGYRAVYKLLKNYLDRVEITVTLIPRQSLLYFPIALLTSRHDRIFLVFCYKRSFPREAHIVRKGYYRTGIKRAIKNIERMRIDTVSIKGTRFYLVYEDANYLNKLMKFVKELNNPSIINHIALVPRNNTLYIAARIKPKNFIEFIDKAYRLALSFS